MLRSLTHHDLLRLASADLTRRNAAADALLDEGREDEAYLLRGESPVRVRGGSVVDGVLRRIRTLPRGSWKWQDAYAGVGYTPRYAPTPRRWLWSPAWMTSKHSLPQLRKMGWDEPIGGANNLYLTDEEMAEFAIPHTDPESRMFDVIPGMTDVEFLSDDSHPSFYGFAEDRAAFEQKIIENPFESTHHMVMGDFLDDNDLPDEAAFRRAMGGWFGAHEWRDYPSDGITRGYHQDKHAANVVMDRTDPYQWDLRGLFLSDKDLARNNPEWPVYFPEGVELPDYWIDAENDPDRHGIVMDTTGSAPGGGFYPMGANIQAIGELLSPHIARHHSSTYPMNSRWRWRDLNAFTEAMRRAFMHDRRAKYEGDDPPTAYQTDYGPREEEIGFHRSLLDAVGNNQPWIPIGLGFSDWLRDSDRIAEAEIIRRASEASGLRTTTWGGPSGDQRIGFHGGRGGEGAGSPPWWFEMTHLHPQGTRDPGEEEIYPNAAFDWRFPIEDDYEGANFAKALMKIGGQPFLGAHWQPDFMGRLGHWTRPEDRVMYPDDITGEFS